MAKFNSPDSKVPSTDPGQVKEDSETHDAFSMGGVNEKRAREAALEGLEWAREVQNIAQNPNAEPVNLEERKAA